MVTLLDKVREMSREIQRSAGSPQEFARMARVLTDLIAANTYVVDTRGRVLGYALQRGFECDILVEEVLAEKRFPQSYSQAILNVRETYPNVTQKERKCVFKEGEPCIQSGKVTTIVPVSGGGERLGTLILARFNEEFSDEDLVLAEYGATVVAIEMMRNKAEKAEEEARRKAAVQVALGTLSYSELEAVRHIFEELGGQEGLLVASKIADRVGITRSVIVNALRKFESAGVIEARSLGMKGTHIKVLNEYLLDEIRKLQ
ncbi:MAG TPA: GTP-sensing pleiotropic transcriptional regulator CodY [Clostridiales bacterium]|nr:GTP-sensing pleiotropic transcriptional regulator CodY [Clostridiales bacterium]